MDSRFDLVMIGAGIVGLAILSKKTSRHQVFSHQVFNG